MPMNPGYTPSDLRFFISKIGRCLCCDRKPLRGLSKFLALLVVNQWGGGGDVQTVNAVNVPVYMLTYMSYVPSHFSSSLNVCLH